MHPFAGKRLSGFWAKLPARRRGAVVIAIPAACIAVTLASWIWSRNSTIIAQQQSDSIEQIISESSALLLEMLNAETAVRGYAVTTESRFLEPYKQAVQQVPQELQKLDALVPDGSAQEQRLQKMVQLSQTGLKLSEQLITLVQTSPPTPERSA
ncbi:MAG TPA: CHASE3 domain-containing protein, partial [Coleofasciculaceae cyanobacterium]